MRVIQNNKLITVPFSDIVPHPLALNNPLI